MRNSKTTEFLKECLADALLQLMKHRPIEKIPIEDIVDLSGVGRSTYFRNFSSKTDMLSFKLIQEWNHWLSERELDITLNSPLHNPKNFFEFIYSNRNTIELIYDAKQSKTVFDAIFAIMKPAEDIDITTHYQNLFYTYALWGVVDEWIKREYQESVKELTELVKTSTQKGGIS